MLNIKPLLLLGLLTLASLSFAAPKSEDLDRIIVVVNDTPIMESELDNAMYAAKQQIASANARSPSAKELHDQVLEHLIDRKLQLQLAEQGGIKITPAQIDKTIQGIATANHLSTKELLTKVKEEGLSIEDYRQEIHDEMTIQQLEQTEVGSRITISPQEVETYMQSPEWLAHNGKEYHLEDLLIALPDNPSTQDIAKAKAHAEAVLATARTGKSFDQIMVEDRSGTGALQGGDLGWRTLPQIPSAFAESIKHMKPDDILGPVATPNGFHLVKLSGIRDQAQQETPTEQHRMVQQQIYEKKMEEGIKTWMARVRSAAFINMHPEN